MYAAKKYLLTGLVRECRRVLEKELGLDTVCTVLTHSISLDECELRKKSLEFISKNTFKVINMEAFKELSHDAVDDVVSLDMLTGTSERRLFEACVRWARHQLKELGNEDPSDEEIRDTLGSVLYKIRFLTMAQKVFAEITTHSKILTAEEKLDVYVYMTTGEKLETLKFLSHSRQMQDNVVTRFTSVSASDSCFCDWSQDAICIETTVDICLTGVGLYGGKKSTNYDVTLTVWKGSETVSKTVTKMTSDGSFKPLKVLLENPVLIRANTRYTVAAVIKGLFPTWLGNSGIGQDIKIKYDISQFGQIRFFPSTLSPNSTSMSRGQIPELFFCM